MIIKFGATMIENHTSGHTRSRVLPAGARAQCSFNARSKRVASANENEQLVPFQNLFVRALRVGPQFTPPPILRMRIAEDWAERDREAVRRTRRELNPARRQERYRPPRTTVFLSPTDLANVVNGIKNQHPELVQRLQSAGATATEQLPNPLPLKQDTSVFRSASALRATPDNELVPILAVVTDALEGQETVLYAGLRARLAGHSFAFLFDEIDPAFHVKLVGHSIKDAQLAHVLPLVLDGAGEMHPGDSSGDTLPSQDTPGAIDAADADAAKAKYDALTSAYRKPNASIYDLRSRQKVDSQNNLARLLPGNFPDNPEAMDSQPQHELLGSADRSADGVVRYLEQLNGRILQIKHSTIRYGLEQRFFRAGLLPSLGRMLGGDSEALTTLRTVAQEWRRALAGALEEERLFSNETGPALLPGPFSADAQLALGTDLWSAKPQQTAPPRGFQAGEPIFRMQAIREQIVAHIRQQLRRQATTGTNVVLRLKPEQLGPIKMVLAVRDGLLDARLEVENPEVKALLESGVAGLRQSLAEAGIQVGMIDIRSLQSVSTWWLRGIVQRGHNAFEDGFEHGDDAEEQTRREHEDKDSVPLR